MAHKYPICWWCGKHMVSAGTGKLVLGVERQVGGNTVRLHKACATQYDTEHAQDTQTVKLHHPEAPDGD